MAEPRGILDILANAGVPPEGMEALARGDQTWTEPDGSFWGMTTVDEPLEDPHQAPVHYGAGAGDAFLVEQAEQQRAEQQRAVDVAYIQAQAAASGEPPSFWGPGSGDAQVIAAQQRPEHQAEWDTFEQSLDAPASLSWGAGNPIMPSGQEQFFPVFSPIGMRVIDRMRLDDWRPSPGEQYFSPSGYNSGRPLGFQTAFTLPGWSGGYQMVGYPGDIQGWIPWGGSGV